MPITPIDAKTVLVGNNDASRLREIQKSQELGQTQLLTQNEDKIQEKFESIHDPDAAEHHALHKEDEDAEHAKGQPDNQKKQAQPKPEEKEEPAPPLPDPDGIRGLKIDFKA